MIRISRNAVEVPPSYRQGSPRLMEAQKQLERHFAKPPVQRRQIRFSFDDDFYTAVDLRERLGQLFHGKCAYCESPIGSVDH